eukprot:CAMPEP_0198251422 /NCGR_PEP_ID=MMETSP1447-20131203/2264_1 /TAXON_ID=420782 /ORGANISM="Chaetoceros dichaeta, Strain CCMP1751" /LENGTH=224 /DNA_ID=CAMNT_0043936437 /DNA_START=52 /DNA_END=726 /DNA_ORIENTATION=+
MKFPPALQPSQVTLLGYGALLSEPSSRLTFPHLTNFRHVRVRGMRRVFGHPHLFLVGEGFADPSETLKLASLSAEPASNDISFVAAAFDVTLDDTQRTDFIRREPEYKIGTTEFYSLEDNAELAGEEGVICLASRDVDLDPKMNTSGMESVWHWPHDSGLLPFNFYLRHCLLAVQSAGGVAYESFLQDTYLADRTTTLAAYLDEHGEEVMASRPPSHLASRYSG